MTKYKLIKEYPGSPKIGTICKYTGNMWDDVQEFKFGKKLLKKIMKY